MNCTLLHSCTNVTATNHDDDDDKRNNNNNNSGKKSDFIELNMLVPVCVCSSYLLRISSLVLLMLSVIGIG